MYNQIIKQINSLANPVQAQVLQRFFKTKPGQYGEGDKFLGLKVPQIRKISKDFSEAQLSDLQKLLNSKIHDYRLAALSILVIQFNLALKNKDYKTCKTIYEFYLKNTKNINNWDLVDLSTPNIVGAYLLLNPTKRRVLYKLAKSKDLWEKRIAIISTFTFIKNNDFNDTLAIAKMLLKDKHDLIHKAVGWMLREVGKRNVKVEESFLKEYYKTMPRTALRYAIEKFSPVKRQKYLQGNI